MNNKKYICVVCHKEYSDTYDHMRENQDQAHKDYEESVSKANYEKECFCGTRLSWFGSEYAWEIRCTNCDLVWDED